MTSSDRFFAGFLAGLRIIIDTPLSGACILRGKPLTFNHVFSQTINGPAGEFVDCKGLGIDYDPLYNVSPWFDRALTRAERNLLIRISGPWYDAIEIAFDKDQAEQLLAMTEQPRDILTLAKTFLSALDAAQNNRVVSPI